MMHGLKCKTVTNPIRGVCLVSLFTLPFLLSACSTQESKSNPLRKKAVPIEITEKPPVEEKEKPKVLEASKDLPTTVPSDSTGKESDFCGKLSEDHNIVPYKTWGTAPENIQALWESSGCNLKICLYWSDKYQVVPGKDWGNLPTSWGSDGHNLREVWKLPEMECDNRVKIENTVSLVQCGKWSEEFNIVPYETWGDAPDEIRNLWEAKDCNPLMCQYWHRKYGVIPHSTWGDLPDSWGKNNSNLREVWKSKNMECDGRVIPVPRFDSSSHPVDLFSPESSKVLEELSKFDVTQKKKMVLSEFHEFYRQMRADDAFLEKDFNIFLRNVDQVFPQLSLFSYFVDWGSKNILNLKGLEVLLNHFKGKDKYKYLLKETIIVKIENFKKTLNSLVDHKNFGEFQMLVQHRWAHVTPVFLKRTQEGTKIVITDSREWTLSHGWVPDLKNQIVKSKLMDSKTLEVFALAQGRQFDDWSCPVMSVRDLLEGSKHSFFDFIENLRKTTPDQIGEIAEEKVGILRFFALHQTPHQLMKVSQSLNTIKKFNETYPDVAKMPASEDGRTLAEVAKDHTEKAWVKAKLKDVNFYTRKRAFKYFGIVLDSALASLGA